MLDETETTPPVSRVRWTDACDASTAAALRAAIRRAEQDGGDVVIDLRGLSVVDPTVVDALRRAGRTIARRGDRLTVQADQPSVRRIFPLLDLDAVRLEPPPRTDDRPDR